MHLYLKLLFYEVDSFKIKIILANISEAYKNHVGRSREL